MKKPKVKDYFEIDEKQLKKAAVMSGFGSLDFKTWNFYKQIKNEVVDDLTPRQYSWLNSIDNFQNDEQEMDCCWQDTF